METPRVTTSSVVEVAGPVVAKVSKEIPEVQVGDRVLYAASLQRMPGQEIALSLQPRLAFVTKVHAGRPGKVNLVYFQVEKGEDPVLFAEDVGYHFDPSWAGYWSKLPA